MPSFIYAVCAQEISNRLPPHLGMDCIVKSVWNGHSKIDKTKILMTNGSLMKVKSIAECSPMEHSAILLTFIRGSILQYFWPSLSFNWSLKQIFGLFESGRLKQALLLHKKRQFRRSNDAVNVYSFYIIGINTKKVAILNVNLQTRYFVLYNLFAIACCRYNIDTCKYPLPFSLLQACVHVSLFCFARQ